MPLWQWWIAFPLVSITCSSFHSKISLKSFSTFCLYPLRYSLRRLTFYLFLYFFSFFLNCHKYTFTVYSKQCEVYFYLFCLVFYWCATSNGAQDLHLALNSGISPGRLWRTYGIQQKELRSISCKANVQFIVLSLQSSMMGFMKYLRILSASMHCLVPKWLL